VLNNVPYQPDWVDGREVGAGDRECANRYQTIARYLKLSGYQLPEKFSVFDFGAYTGYFSRRLHEDFGAECVAVDSQPRLRPVPGVRCIHYQMRAEGILKQPHYDMALCLSVLHHHQDWREYLANLRARSSILFVETAHPLETLPKPYRIRNQHQKLREIGAQIGAHPGWNTDLKRTMWVVKQ
jgi:Methyltransferase domain